MKTFNLLMANVCFLLALDFGPWFTLAGFVALLCWMFTTAIDVDFFLREREGW